MTNFKKGDIVISLKDQTVHGEDTHLPIKKGNINRIANVGLDNGRTCLWFKETTCGNYTVSNFRYATPEEQTAFIGGITNIEDIKEQGLNIVGRWVQARYDDPISITSWKKYDYRKILKFEKDTYYIGGGFTFRYAHITDGIIKLMAKDFSYNDLTGRYVKLIRKTDPVKAAIGDYIKLAKIFDSSDAGYFCKDSTVIVMVSEINSGMYELMPEDFELPITATKKWEPKVGKWYKTIGDQFITNKYIKYLCTTSDGAIVFQERITQANKYNNYPEYQSTSIANPKDSLVEVPDSEVAQYIPAQYIPKKESYKPKVGDWVVITKGSNWSSFMDKFIGKCVKISIVTSDGNSIKFPGCETWNWLLNNNHFRPALEYERPVVNDTSDEILVDKNDWIIFNNTGGNCGDARLYINKPYRLIERSYKSKCVNDIDWTIEDAEGNQPRVRLKDNSKYHYNTYWRKCTFDEIPGSKLECKLPIQGKVHSDIDIPTYKSKRVLPGILPQVMNRTDVHQALILGLI